jgi:hypothetical protein
MTRFKKSPMALTLMGLCAASAFAEIKINDNLSTSGFVDMSALGAKVKDVDATLGGSLDQYELDFMYKFGFFSARADLNGGTSGAFSLEQAFITAALTEKVNLGMGRFLSSSGFEAAEPTGLYQYSTSKTLVYGGYQNGLNLSYTTPMFGLYGAVVSDLWKTTETELANSPGFEGQISVTPAEGVTAKATMLWQMYDKGDTTTLGDENQGLANAWVSYAKGPLTVAAEYNYLISWKTKAGDDLAGMGWLAMANYKITDKVATTVRYSSLVIADENSATNDMGSEVTFSPSFAVSPNWLLLAEVKQEFGNVEQTDYAVESTFSF